MLLAGDVGGTKTHLGLFVADGRRPRAVVTRTYATSAFANFGGILEAFERDAAQPLRPAAAAIGVAGPVVAGQAKLTNIDWDISAEEIALRLGTPHVALLNDLEAMANSVEVLSGEELLVLQEGVDRPDGNAVVIAAGTGLGEAFLHRVDGRLRPVPSEGGHADFAARTDRELEFVRMLRERAGRVGVEQVLSGPGLVNLYQFTHRGGQCAVVEDIAADQAPARISEAGMSGRCQFCVEALRMFVDAYGAEAGNLALRGVATSGVFVGGGIAPKIRRALQDGRFIEAFLDKPPMRELLSRMPVRIILNREAGLLGAAVHAHELPRAR